MDGGGLEACGGEASDGPGGEVGAASGWLGGVVDIGGGPGEHVLGAESPDAKAGGAVVGGGGSDI